MDFIFDLLILVFFGRGELFVCHSELCRLFSGSYSKIHDSSPVMTCLKTKIAIFDVFKKVQARISSVFLWSLLKFIGISFALFFCMPTSSVKMSWTVHWFKFSSLCQTSIRPHDRPRFGHIFVRFWRASSSRKRVVFHILTAIQKCFTSPKNLCPRYSTLSIIPL